MTSFSPPLTDASEQDETAEFRPKFDSNSLIPAIAQDAETGEVLMMAWMNAEALAATIETGKGTYYSRSRGQLWVKGESSGHVQIVTEILTDCDQDVILLKINQTGAACHTNRRSCFYRKLSNGQLLKD